MKTYQANMLNVLTLITMSLWAYFAYEPIPEKMSPSLTTFIPLFFGGCVYFNTFYVRINAFT